MVGKFFGAGIKVLNKVNHKTSNVRLIFVKDIGFVEFIGALIFAIIKGVENSGVASEISSDTIAIISRESFKIELDGEVSIVNQRVDLKRSEDKYTFTMIYSLVMNNHSHDLVSSIILDAALKF